MALPLRATDVLPRRVPEFRVLPAPSLELNPDQLDALIEELAEALDDVESFEEGLGSSFEGVRSSLASTHTGEGDDESLDAIADALQELERKLAKNWGKVQESTERAIFRARELSSREPLWDKYAALLDRFAHSTVRLLETLRDHRLELAAVLTARARVGDGMVFDDPEELKKYLDSI